ncbi:MAG: hypothetical protein QG597_2411 [Actinomycetota bacterium]|nr:hypothetical protein [Actinomycetota bacterium]
MAIPSRAEVDALVRAKLADDPAFREVLLADPRVGLSQLVGVDIPDSVAVTVHEESLTDIHLVLAAQTGGGEIAEDDLELVAGGGACWDNCGCTSGP